MYYQEGGYQWRDREDFEKKIDETKKPLVFERSQKLINWVFFMK